MKIIRHGSDTHRHYNRWTANIIHRKITSKSFARNGICAKGPVGFVGKGNNVYCHWLRPRCIAYGSPAGAGIPSIIRLPII